MSESNFLTEMGLRIKNRRIENGLTQSELAEKTGYKEKSSIAHIEHGEVDIPQSKIEVFARVLNCTPAYLMGWESNDAHEQALILYQKYLQAPEQARQTIDYILKLQQPDSEHQ